MSRPAARLTAQDFHPEVLKLFDQYVHGFIDRRAFIGRSGQYAAAGVTGTMLLEMLNPKFAEAQQVKPDDARITAKYVEYFSAQGSGRMRGYLVLPAQAPARLPGVLVVHENRGLNPHTEDVARRMALEGFAAFAPDALTPQGGYPGSEDKARELFGKLDPAASRNDMIAGVEYLRKLPSDTGKVGAVGFCWGGGICNMLATRIPDLGASAPFYGSQAPVADVPKIKCPLQLHYASNDERINAGWPAYEAALKEAKVTYEGHVYPNTQHGFLNDTTPRYDDAAAKLAWSRTVAFFRKHL
ncbi:MAG: dienelactone hydrolase family protein [Betaproteobacteria bacterium]|nr:dienelactone hydrolase family protein [Betaproteobacteria bacterium]